MNTISLTELEKISLINEAHRLLDEIDILLDKTFDNMEKAMDKGTTEL